MSARAGERGGLIARLIGLLILVVLIVALFLVRHSLMTAAGEWLVVSDSLTPANAIVMLSGDDVEGDRAARAAQLYKTGWAPVIVASGSQIRPYLSETDLETRDLTQDGVPAAAIVPLRQTDLYTLAEARDLRQLVLARGWHRVIVVTSNFHTRRARYIFRHVFPATVEVEVTPASDGPFQPDGWWESRQGMKIFARETAALCVAFWELHVESGEREPRRHQAVP
jgi:uncharacterized SAM-binding protein YcdF (DUF218 family)